MDSAPTQSVRSISLLVMQSAACIRISMPVPHTRCTMYAGTSIGTSE
jgi:hypothetical protein